MSMWLGDTMHSAPPQIARSTVPRRIIRNDSPMAWAELVQAVWMVQVGPSAPNIRASRTVAWCGRSRVSWCPRNSRQYRSKNADGRISEAPSFLER